jgi:hypothetical protein
MKMGCIALVSFAHTPTADPEPDRLHCACEFCTHTKAAEPDLVQ